MQRTISRKNPYISRGPVRDPELFFGRSQPLEEIAAFLSGNQSVSLIGPSKIGKTSLLFQLMRPEAWPSLGLEPDNVFVYFDCETLVQSTPDAIFGQIAAEMEAALRARGLRLEPAGAALAARRAFEAGVRQLNQFGLRLVLILDAFERLSTNSHLDVSFFNGLRAAAVRHRLVFLTAST